MLGPSTDIHGDHVIPTPRTIGYRKIAETLPPIAHAKLALLGTIAWTDEDPVGGVTDYVWFNAILPWPSSANFTYASRRGLEIGYLTEDAQLIDGVKCFLVSLIGACEDLDAAADTPDPELVDVELEEDAMAEAAAESYWAVSMPPSCAARTSTRTSGSPRARPRPAALAANDEPIG
jgi:hypothetical protein